VDSYHSDLRNAWCVMSEGEDPEDDEMLLGFLWLK
jgi:hypothetical protein